MVQLTRLVLALVAAVGLATAAHAVDMTNPKSVLEAAYAPYLAGDTFDWENYDDSVYNSAGLNALYERDAKESEAAGEIGRIDYDPLINGQDYDIANLKIGDPAITGDKATVHVTFDNFDTAEDLTILMVREQGKWLIDDIQAKDENNTVYGLREVLEAPFPQ